MKTTLFFETRTATRISCGDLKVSNLFVGQPLLLSTDLCLYKLHSCLIRRLGCLGAPPLNEWHVVISGETPSYESSGPWCYSLRPPSPQRCAMGQDRCTFLQQLDHPFLPNQTRQDTLVFPQFQCPSSLVMDRNVVYFLMHCVRDSYVLPAFITGWSPIISMYVRSARRCAVLCGDFGGCH